MSHSHGLRHLFPGLPLALASAALFGATAPISKLLLDAIEPVMLAGLLYLGAGIGLALYSAIGRVGGRAARAEAGLRRPDLPWLAGAIVMGGIVGPALLLLGLARTSASTGALLLNLEGLATMAIAWLWFRENVDRRLLLGAAAILGGAVLLSWQGQGIEVDAGALLVAGACLAWGIDNNLTRQLSATDPVTLAMLKGLVAGLANIGLAVALGSELPSVSAGLLAGLVGFLGIGISLTMFILALRHLGTARTGAYYALAPFIGAAIAVLVLGEPLTLRLALAGLLMGLGLWLHIAERHDHLHEHEAIEHDHRHRHDEHHRHHDDASGAEEPHAHPHRHGPLRHRHLHFPDLHHRHRH